MLTPNMQQAGTSPVSELQTRTVLSQLPETILLPSANMARAQTGSVCPLRTLNTCNDPLDSVWNKTKKRKLILSLSMCCVNSTLWEAQQTPTK